MKKAKWIELLDIIEQVQKDRGDKFSRDPIAAAEHDVIYLDMTTSDIEEDSELGKKLKDEFNLSIEFDSWCKYT